MGSGTSPGRGPETLMLKLSSMIRRPQDVLSRQQEHEGERFTLPAFLEYEKTKDGCGDLGG